MQIRIGNDGTEIEGYVNAVGRESRVMRDKDGYFTETIQPGAFARALPVSYTHLDVYKRQV